MERSAEEFIVEFAVDELLMAEGSFVLLETVAVFEMVPVALPFTVPRR